MKHIYYNIFAILLLTLSGWNTASAQDLNQLKTGEKVAYLIASRPSSGNYYHCVYQTRPVNYYNSATHKFSLQTMQGCYEALGFMPTMQGGGVARVIGTSNGIFVKAQLIR